MGLVEYKGFLVREGFLSDTFVVDESASKKFAALLGPGDVLLDMGAFIGTTSCRAALAGAHAVAYEPHPESFGVLALNAACCEGPGSVTPENSAIAAQDGGTVTLWQSPRSVFTHSLIRKRGFKEGLEVPRLGFRAELDRLEPTALKLDVEGAEYEFLDELRDLAGVRKAWLEFHFIQKPGYRERVDPILESLLGQGFSFVSGPRLGGVWNDFLQVRAVR